jgi:hypothetical protein
VLVLVLICFKITLTPRPNMDYVCLLGLSEPARRLTAGVTPPPLPATASQMSNGSSPTLARLDAATAAFEADHGPPRVSGGRSPRRKSLRAVVPGLVFFQHFLPSCSARRPHSSLAACPLLAGAPSSCLHSQGRYLTS